MIPDFDSAVMGGCCHPRGDTRRHREKHAAGCGLKVASVLHYFAAGLAQIPELMKQTQLQSEQEATSEEHMHILQNSESSTELIRDPRNLWETFSPHKRAALCGRQAKVFQKVNSKTGS